MTLFSEFISLNPLTFSRLNARRQGRPAILSLIDAPVILKSELIELGVVFVAVYGEFTVAFLDKECNKLGIEKVE